MSPISGFRRLLSVLCLVACSATTGADRPEPARPEAAALAGDPDRPDAAIAAPGCRDDDIEPCPCAAGKGYRPCRGGAFGACVCERPDDRPPIPTEELRPPTAGDLAGYTRDLQGDGALVADIVTTMGTIRCELHEDRAPMTVANFVGLARGLKAWRHPETEDVTRNPLYDGLTFHRVVPDFMIQGGDPQGDGRGGPGYRFADEFHPELRHDRPGTLAMANSGDNTNGCQFYITEKATPWLDDDFTVFGHCDNGDVVKRIARLPPDPEAASRPAEPVYIRTVRIRRRSGAAQ